jgi:uncharacterized membrane protein
LTAATILSTPARAVAEHAATDFAERRVARAAALGGVAGVRSMAPLAALAARGCIGGDGAGRYVLIAAGIGECLADKHPRVPSRSALPALAERLVTSALAGREVAGARGAVAAAGAAGVSAVTAERARGVVARRTGLPDAVVGLLEDALAAGAAVALTRRVRS